MGKKKPKPPRPRVLVADPPWLHGDQLPGKGRGAGKHYGCMRTIDIQAMEIPQVGRNCFLFLWNLHTHKRDAISVATAWGFEESPVGELIWRKTTNNGSKIRIGMGHGVRMASG